MKALLWSIAVTESAIQCSEPLAQRPLHLSVIYELVRHEKAMLDMSINLARGLRQRCKRRGMKVAALNGNGFDTLFRQPERQLVHLCSYTGGSPLL